MSIEVEVLLQEAKENIEAAQNYRAELQQRLHGLNQARKQVRGSASQTQEVLRRHFQELQAGVSRLLNERLGLLLEEVDAIEQDSVRPLDDCQKLIEHGVSAADELLREGEAAIRCGIGEKDDKLGSFTKKALQIQLDSLPEVPALVDVPCLSAQLDDSLLSAVTERIARHGSVAAHPPVQIEELVERPGGVLVRWCKVDDDFTVQDYRLQYRRGNASQYEDAYIGKDSEFLVLHLDPHTDHLFRVCARGDGRAEWSPWSVPQTGYTTLAPHEWRPNSDGYILSSRRNIAMRSDSPSSARVLYSSSPTYFCGQTLTFQIMAAGQVHKQDSLGVCVEDTSGAESLQKDRAVCISTNGAVFVNGKEMTNQLPAISPGSAVTFDMEVVGLFPMTNNNMNDGGNCKLRVTIGSGNREVVFDWLLDQGVDCLFFGCSFVYPGWKVLVF
ncbi:cytokine receptor-like factor 3 isoform X2 [Paramormyrops kingsleyae]|uniref:Cytokine receptor-like factor 3 n=2 Tax=Paramormyrops kingsleyae TaxID=1676925 RepID=A0A3B3RMS6_9TELE|nr:cytokine receptor-like factor 3 isoform X2 [Paramormyrops kingsleyae]XP_023647802.1 cytokine receptor-like factor 3 isoform X3 [Paramormyrops kingsleyae]XP_023647803.1 cytokine receptor-like factor 3 isoform X2 [Paramormyrops kingsleyae]